MAADMGTYHMFEPFSSGYYVGRLYIEPHDGERTLMQRDQHERANSDIYAAGTGIDRLDHPLIVKVDSSHFAVEGEDGVPEDTLYVPRDHLQPRPGDRLPALKEVLVAKKHRAEQLMSLFGLGTGPSGT